MLILLLIAVLTANSKPNTLIAWQPDIEQITNTSQTDFIKSLEINKILAEHPGKSYYIDKLIQDEISTSLPDEDITSYFKIVSSMDLLSDEKISELYEEPVSEEIIEDSGKHKEITQINIKIDKKPPYFGPVPLIAIVIDDMGISPKRTGAISSLQAPITSSFLTYAKMPEKQMEVAQSNGHEIILHIPMEPKISKDIAPDTLTTSMDIDEVVKNFEQMLNTFPNIKGINNHMGSKLTEDNERMTSLMNIFAQKKMFFLDSKTSSASVGEKIAIEKGVPTAHRHVFLDNKNDFNYISAQLAISEKIARKYGHCIAIGHPKTQTYEALNAWLPTLKEKNIKLVHLSKIVDILNN